MVRYNLLSLRRKSRHTTMGLGLVSLALGCFAYRPLDNYRQFHATDVFSFDDGKRQTQTESGERDRKGNKEGLEAI